MLSLAPTQKNFTFNTYLLNLSKQIQTKRIVSSQIICKDKCFLLNAGVSQLDESTEYYPVDYEDSGEVWTNEANAFDGSLLSMSAVVVPANDWCDFLVLFLDTPLPLNSVLLFPEMAEFQKMIIDIDYYLDGNWYDLYEGVLKDYFWSEVMLSSVVITDTFRIRAYTTKTNNDYLHLYEFRVFLRKLVDIGLFNGYDSSYDKISRLLCFNQGSRFYGYNYPIFCNKGLYADFGISSGELVVSFLPL